MSSFMFMSLHQTTSATVSEWRSLRETFSCTLTVTDEEGVALKITLFSKTPFDIQRDAPGASKETSHE